VFCAALDAERERAGLTKAFVGKQLGLSPATVTELFKGRIERAPAWERVGRILELCWEAANQPPPAASERALAAAQTARRREYLQSWRIRHGILEHELQTARSRQPGKPSSPSATVHYGHVLLGSLPLTCRTEESTLLARWGTEPAERNVLCVTGPGGQGKSALAWTYFTNGSAVGAIRLWHSFSGEPDPAAALTATLARSARQAFGSAEDDESAAALLQQRMRTEGGLIVLDAVEYLFGPSGRVLDAASSKFRTIADPRVEDLIRGLIALPQLKVLITCRLAPAFLDDPAVHDHVRRMDLCPIDAGDSVPFWRSMKVRGTTGQLAAATAALYGSPLLMRLVARRVRLRRDGDISAWLTKDRARITQADDSSLVDRLVSLQSGGDLSDLSRQLLLLLAISRRRLSRLSWRDLATGKERRKSGNGQTERLSQEEAESLDEAVSDLLDSDLVHRDAAGDFDLHELLADAIIAAAEEEELNEAYRKLDAAEKPMFYLPGMGFQWDQTDSMADRATLANNTGRFLSLLDRGAWESAWQILATELYPALRFRVGDLRELRALCARYDLLQARHGLEVDRSAYDVELALADGNWDEVIALVGHGDRRYLRSFVLADRAEARSGRGEFAEAYRDASAACFWAWRDESLQDAVYRYVGNRADATQWIMFGAGPGCSGYHDGVAAQLVLSKVLRSAGFRHTALLVLTVSFPLGHSHPGELSAHWEECGALLSELGQPALARRACESALAHARADGAQEYLLRGRTLDFELRSRAGGRLEASELAELLAEVTRLGFGVLARRLLPLYRWRDGLFSAVAWQYKMDALSHPPQVSPSAADDLLGELAILAGIRQPGQWAEYKLLSAAVESAAQPDGISADGLLREAWESVVGGSWSEQARSWLGRWKPDAETSAHLAATHRLGLLEDDRAAARALATNWTQGDPEQAREQLLAAVFYEPTGWGDDGLVEEAMVLAARASGRLPDAIWALVYMMGAGWKVPETALLVAGLCRETGDYEKAFYVSLGASEDANNNAPGGAGPASDVVRIALILGAGLDLLALGCPPDRAVDEVWNGLSGRLMTSWQSLYSRNLRVIGDDVQPDPAQRHGTIGGTFGIAHRLDQGTVGHAALELFRNIAGSDGTGKNQEASLSEWFTRWGALVEAEQIEHAADTARQALGEVRGHDTLIARFNA